jgi:hypothetical protein
MKAQITTTSVHTKDQIKFGFLQKDQLASHYVKALADAKQMRTSNNGATKAPNLQPSCTPKVK